VEGALPTEKPLVHLDHAGWEDLVTRHHSRMWAVARAFGLSAADAADAVQGAWLRMVESLDTIRDPERIGAWLITTTRHEAARLRRKSLGERPAEFTLPDPAEPDPASAIVDADFGRRVWRHLDDLGEPCRSLLRLFAVCPDVTYAQIAMRLGIPIGSIGPTRARCLARLRALVKQRVQEST
jgi:RNA polymerase sigma factor (sigma-70 family)